MIASPSVVWLCVIAAIVSGAMHLAATYRGPARLRFLFKPLTTTLLIGAAALAPAAEPRYRLLIVAGLVLSLAGDIFLMLPRDHFMAGLVAFLIAHLCYIGAFTSDTTLGAAPLMLLPFVLAALVVLVILWPRLGRLRIPVVVYIFALVVMAWQAAARALVLDTNSAIGAAIGATLFVVSDATLAIDRFRARFRAAQAVIMTTYVIAQAFIALSVLP